MIPIPAFNAADAAKVVAQDMPGRIAMRSAISQIIKGK
jgi:hypothetical protein